MSVKEGSTQEHRVQGVTRRGWAKAPVLWQSGDYPWKLNRAPVNDVLVEGERDELKNESSGNLRIGSLTVNEG